MLEVYSYHSYLPYLVCVSRDELEVEGEGGGCELIQGQHQAPVGRHDITVALAQVPLLQSPAGRGQAWGGQVLLGLQSAGRQRPLSRHRRPLAGRAQDGVGGAAGALRQGLLSDQRRVLLPPDGVRVGPATGCVERGVRDHSTTLQTN